MENTTSSSNKRYRGGSEVYSGDAKRLRPTDLIYILDDDEDDLSNQVSDRAAHDIAAIMNSLEEEMGFLSPPPPLLMQQQQPDLCYLLEASDDELGLPPASSTSSEEEYFLDVVVHNNTGDAPPEAMSGSHQMWGFNNDISCSFGDGLGIIPDVALSFDDDDGILNYTEELFGQQQQDYSDFLSWQSEFLPTTVL